MPGMVREPISKENWYRFLYGKKPHGPRHKCRGCRDLTSARRKLSRVIRSVASEPTRPEIPT